jgi:hypothetical protein
MIDAASQARDRDSHLASGQCELAELLLLPER